MPATPVWIEDELAAYSTDTNEDTSTYHFGSLIPYLGDVLELVWDDPSIRPPEPKHILPPNGTPPTPPRVRRIKVPPPSY